MDDRMADALRQCHASLVEMIDTTAHDDTTMIRARRAVDAAEAALLAHAALAAQPQEPAREPSDEEILAIYDAEIARGGPADAVIVRTSRAVRAWPGEPHA